MPRFTLSLAAVVLFCAACRHKEAAPPPPPPAPPPAPVVPQSCGPLGLWNMQSPNGTDQVEVTQAETPETFIVKHHSNASAPGVGTYANQEFRVDMSKSMGLYTCKIADDCQSMTCNIAGVPATMKRAY